MPNLNDVSSILQECKKNRVTLSLVEEGTRIKLRSPKGAIISSLKEAISSKRDEIIPMLRISGDKSGDQTRQNNHVVANASDLKCGQCVHLTLVPGSRPEHRNETTYRFCRLYDQGRFPMERACSSFEINTK